jgi:hypothetical protein
MLGRQRGTGCRDRARESRTGGKADPVVDAPSKALAPRLIALGVKIDCFLASYFNVGPAPAQRLHAIWNQIVSEKNEIRTRPLLKLRSRYIVL